MKDLVHVVSFCMQIKSDHLIRQIVESQPQKFTLYMIFSIGELHFS